MNEIEKMYKLAEVQPQYKKRIECKEGHRVGQPCGKCPCINCDKSIFEDVMPPFKAEKQLELIKWLAKTGDVCRIDATVKNKWFVENEVGYSKCFAKFEEALANVINNIWEYMPEEEKEQIRRVLK